MGKKHKPRTERREVPRPSAGGPRDVLGGTVPVATFTSLGDVRQALARVADADFAIDRTTIVGTDLRLVERIEGRRSGARAAGYGTVGGAWLGALIAAFAAVFSATSFAAVLSMLFGGIVLGALFGAVFGLVAYRVAGSGTGITGNVGLVAARYELRTEPGSAARLRELLPADGTGGTVLLDAPAPATADDLLTRR
jgi:hypothetical protein